MLAHAEMQVPPAIGAGLEAARPLEGEVGLGRRRQVGGAADQPGQVERDRVQDLARAFAGRDALLVGLEGRDLAVPALRQLVLVHHLELGGELGILGPVAAHHLQPGGVQAAAAIAEIGLEVLWHPVRHIEALVLGPAVEPLGAGDLLVAQRLAMRRRGAGLLRRAVGDLAVHHDQRRLAAGDAVLRPRLLEPLPQQVEVVGVRHLDHVPAIALEPAVRVLNEGELGRALDADLVAVVEPGQVGELQVAGDRGRLAGHPLHMVAISAEGPYMVVEHRVARLVVAFREPALRHRHADRVAAALAERPGGGLDPRGEAVFRVSGRLAAELAELLDVIDRQRWLRAVLALVHRLHARQQDQRVQQHGRVADRQHEAIAVWPVRVVRVVAQQLVPQHVAGRRQRHRRAGMA